MSRYWIYDCDNTPQRFPLVRLIRKVREWTNESQSSFIVKRSQGYGLTVNKWNELLDDADEISVSADVLEELAAEQNEWFYDLDATCVTARGAISFGVFDSTALFVDAPAEVASILVSDFERVQLE